ncbi:hypothetical protein CPAR01_06487 [Colletotrichum paranaense]|uniref:Uncharacterized protein n=1 Tax=Colletotrichum paranaense TaxID=1914294 RepID=A0ABQ9SLU8_9PEZI|nr:uncharacterized protein CPAR01_06487 [Colletotrichum paranaense]KAK1540498.1 hypothetical protein CPAR01_06487 [Colletotrichum paranaense]
MNNTYLLRTCYLLAAMFCLALIIDYLITALNRLGSDKESATNSDFGAEEVGGNEELITDDEELITNDEQGITDDDEWVTDDEEKVTDEEKMTSLFGKLPT